MYRHNTDSPFNVIGGRQISEWDVVLIGPVTTNG